MATFRYNPTGCDNNGNFGPAPEDAGWLIIDASDYDDAVEKLPPGERDKVKASIAEYYSDQPQRPTTPDYGVVRTFICDSCGWGVGFSLYDEESWQYFLDECV